MTWLKWHLSQKIVCLDAKDTNDKPGGPTIRENEVYTIDQIVIDGAANHGRLGPETGLDELCFHLIEVVRTPCTHCGRAVPYAARRFQPLDERETDISVFESALHTTKVKMPEPETA